jgi:iron(III) transport system substrate-binding protein
MKRNAIAGIGALLAFLIFAVTALSFAADNALIEAAKQEGQVHVYTAFPRRFLDPIANFFKKKYNLGDDFKVIFTRKGTGAIAQMVEAEHMSCKSRWDSVSHSEEGVFLRWIDEGILLKFQPPNIGNIREEFRDPYGYRVGNIIAPSNITVNAEKIPKKDWPKRYKDLLNPKWKGRIGVMDPTTAGPGVMVTKFLLDLYGWDFIRELGRNKPVLVKGCSALDPLLLSGEIHLALCAAEHDIIALLMAGETKLQLIYPEEGTPYYVMWTGINSQAPHPNSAKLWMEFNADDETLKFFTENAGRYITSKNVKLGYPRPELKFYKIDWKWIKVHKDEMCKRFLKELQKGRAESN